MTALKTVIVTGANRGIGKAICQLILSRPDAAQIKLIATSRQGKDLELGPNARYPHLDVGDERSIKAFADEIGRSDGKVDVLINNAGTNLDAEYNAETAKKTLDVNYRGTLKMCQAFIPLLSSNGRIVNLSSVASSLKPYSEQIQQRFRNPDMTLEDLEQLAQEYEASVSSHSEAEQGFVGPNRSYSFSKSCVNAFTRILAQKNPNVTINACCPGWVKTDMGLLIGRAPKTPEDGAKVPVRLAFGEIGGETGKYWANSSVRGKGEGEVQEW